MQSGAIPKEMPRSTATTYTWDGIGPGAGSSIHGHCLAAAMIAPVHRMKSHANVTQMIGPQNRFASTASFVVFMAEFWSSISRSLLPTSSTRLNSRSQGSKQEQRPNGDTKQYLANGRSTASHRSVHMGFFANPESERFRRICVMIHRPGNRLLRTRLWPRNGSWS